MSFKPITGYASRPVLNPTGEYPVVMESPKTWSTWVDYGGASVGNCTWDITNPTLTLTCTTDSGHNYGGGEWLLKFLCPASKTTIHFALSTNSLRAGAWLKVGAFECEDQEFLLGCNYDGRSSSGSANIPYFRFFVRVFSLYGGDLGGTTYPNVGDTTTLTISFT